VYQESGCCHTTAIKITTMPVLVNFLLIMSRTLLLLRTINFTFFIKKRTT
jgi:hypothetical protein